MLLEQCQPEHFESDSGDSCPSDRHGARDPEQAGSQEEAGVHRSRPRVSEGQPRSSRLADNVVGSDQGDLSDPEAYLREKNEHWKGWTKSRFILEIEMYEADIMEELALTGTTAAEMTKEASGSDNPGPMAPTCPTCGIGMLQRTNRVTGNQFWGCHLFPSCRKTFPLLIDGKPTAVVVAAMEKQREAEKFRQKDVEEDAPVPDKRGGYPKSPNPSVAESLASWESVGEAMATASEGRADQKYNVNLTEAEMKALTERRKSKWDVKPSSQE